MMYRIIKMDNNSAEELRTCSSRCSSDSILHPGKDDCLKSCIDMKAFVNLENGSNATDISPILTCIRTINESVVWNEDRSKYVKSLSLKQLKQETKVTEEDGFAFAVSLRNGSCLYTSDSMSKHLGYPHDMLERQCFMNFLFHKDHITFANHLTQGLNACFIQEKRDDSHLALNTFFCRLRMYHSLKDGYSISDRKTIYKPFRITLHINELIVDDVCVEEMSGTLCVNATATLVSSAYSVPEEIPAMTSFSTRHTSSCHFSHVDASAIPYVGYLPQDMIGFSVFDFYHAEDMPQLKDIYELVVKERGSSFRSKPYRFKIQNGCFIMLETEWSCFINPWSHKLEFVVGQHRVLKGPSNVDIFTPPEKIENYLPEEIIKESQKIQKEIKNLLSESIHILQAKKSKRFCNKRKRDLINFVYKSFVYSNDEPKGSKLKGNTENQLLEIDDAATSDSDSVVMGDISPYREVNDSSFASETLPTVQQLQLQENIDRFFASEPKTYSDGSDESNKNEKLSSGDHSQISSSESGNGSGNTSASKCEQPSPTTSQNDYKNNQQRGSNSSKCNLSTFSDSGYGKSFGNNCQNDPGTSQGGSSVQQAWPNDRAKDPDAFSSCLALTEKSLSAHNHINHKHFKQQRKGKPSLSSTRENWLQQKDASKHKKNQQNQTLKISTLTQTDEKLGTEQKKQPWLADKSVPSPNLLNPYMFSPMNACGPTPTPFFIPVMYMGSMPYFPSSPNAQPHWPFGPAPSSTETASKPDPTAERPQFPIFPSTSAGYPQSAFSKFENSESLHHTSGLDRDNFRAPSTPCKTSATVSTEYSTSYQNSRGKCKNSSEDYRRVVENFTDAVKSRTQNVKSDSAESDMQTEQSPSSSYFTRSSSFQSADKDEDMDCEKDKLDARIGSDKVELTSKVAYRYQMDIPSIEDTLMKDREVLKSMKQPDLVIQQLLLLQGEREEENECKLNVGEGDFNITEEIMLGLATEDSINDYGHHLAFPQKCSQYSTKQSSWCPYNFRPSSSTIKL